MGSPEMDMGLKNIEVEVRYKLGASPLTRFTVKVRPTDSLRKIKNHIVQSLDIEGKVMYREQNCDDQPTKRLSDCTTKKEEIFHVAAEKKLRDLKHHTVKLHLPEEFATQDAAELKIARTTTIGNLKHKLQDEYGIPVEEQNIHMLGQDTECQSGANIMQLHLSAKSVHLEVKWQRKEASPPRPSRVKRTQSLKSSCSLASGTPYAQAVKLSRRNSLELSSIHPKSLTKLKKKPEPEEPQSGLNASLQHATFETLYQIGKNFETFKNDKTKKIIVECEHSKEKENTVNIKSEVIDNTDS